MNKNSALGAVFISTEISKSQTFGQNAGRGQPFIGCFAKTHARLGLRNIEIRGCVVEMTEDEAIEQGLLRLGARRRIHQIEKFPMVLLSSIQ